MTTAALLAACLGMATAHGSEPLLISRFEALDADSDGVASLVPELLELELMGSNEFPLVDHRDVPAIGDLSAVMYLESCPPGQAVGCAIVVGQAAGATFAIAGTVESQEATASASEDFLAADPLDDLPEAGEAAEPVPEHRVTLFLLDVASFEELATLTLTYTPDTEASFTRSVPALLRGARSSFVARNVDIRHDLDSEFDAMLEERELEDTREDMESLARELGDVRDDEVSRSYQGDGGKIDRERASMADLSEHIRGRPLPWVEHDMGPRQYLAWYNSGWDHRSWTRMRRGRARQFVLRFEGAVEYGPTLQSYDCDLVLDYGDLDAERTTIRYQLSPELGGGGGLSLGFGLASFAELEIGVGGSSGRYEAEARELDLQGFVVDTGTSGDLLLLLRLWAGVRLAPWPARPVRPLLGAGIARLTGGRLAGDALPLAQMDPMVGPGSLAVRGLLGAELRLSPTVDLVLAAPVFLALQVQPPRLQSSTETTGEVPFVDLDPLALPASMSFAGQLALQVRLGGKATDAGTAFYPEEIRPGRR